LSYGVLNMIKKLIFIAALLAPGLAYGGNPSANLTVQIAPTSDPPNSIACDIGPNYTGSIPAGAQAAGFTHCAANYDFTSSQFASLSNWLDCAGASTPLWYSVPDGTSSDLCSAAGTSMFAMTSDGSLPQVLGLTYGPTMYSTGIYDTKISTTNRDPFSAGTSFPLGAYYEAVYRTTASAIGWCPSSQTFCVNLAWWNWSLSGNTSLNPNPTFIEFDNDEIYSSGSGMGWGQWNPRAFSSQVTPLVQTVSGYDASQYGTYGARMASDGRTTVQYCSYFSAPYLSFSGNLACATYNPSAGSTQFTQRNINIFSFGPQFSSVPSPTKMGNAYIQRVTVFTCPGWKTGQCNNASIPAP
jgi:hypothetical protein